MLHPHLGPFRQLSKIPPNPQNPRPGINIPVRPRDDRRPSICTRSWTTTTTTTTRSRAATVIDPLLPLPHHSRLPSITRLASAVFCFFAKRVPDGVTRRTTNPNYQFASRAQRSARPSSTSWQASTLLHQLQFRAFWGDRPLRHFGSNRSASEVRWLTVVPTPTFFNSQTRTAGTIFRDRHPRG